MDPLLRTGKDLEDIYQRHVDMLYRVAYSFMKNGADAEDMVQETFLRLMRSGTVFESAQHEKAWLIVTVSNLCKSALRSPWRRREDLDALSDQPTTEDAAPDETLQAVLALPDDYKLLRGLSHRRHRPDAEGGSGHCPKPPEPRQKETEIDLGR